MQLAHFRIKENSGGVHGRTCEPSLHITIFVICKFLRDIHLYSFPFFSSLQTCLSTRNSRMGGGDSGNRNRPEGGSDGPFAKVAQNTEPTPTRVPPAATDFKLTEVLIRCRNKWMLRSRGVEMWTM